MYSPSLLPTRSVITAFRVNLMLGVRFVQAALLTPLHHTTAVGARALPIGFQEVSRVKRPRECQIHN
jgi:hypothetical protein